ncbi:hypothetical protein ABPG72_003847 [Tetrahymena utriculariae]
MSTLQRIIKGASDIRNYKSIVLKNKLQCLLVSDEKADKSSAAMNVNVGHLQDPIDRPGLAHFLEHMLFMGTEKYPNQSEYSDYLSKNGGFSNAYTSQMETNYYFACQNSSIEGALDRFSQFFVKPLFSETCVEKEINAVDSEHQKNIMQDSWRFLQLFRSSAHKHTEFCKFATGNLQTLSHPTIRNDLIQFYNKYYSANLMRLVIYSNKNIDQMENWAQSYFSDIPNHDLLPPSFKDLPFTQENLANLWKVVPIKDIHQLSVKWILPDMRKYYKNNPASYLSHLLGHEGENSLLSILIKNGLAVELSAGNQNEQNLWSSMNIEISLTNKGVENYEQVLQYLFSYIEMLKEKGVQEWVFNEIQMLNKLNFDNKDYEKPENYTLSLASRMQYYPIEEVLIQPYLNEQYDRQLIQETINQFNIENVRITVISKRFADQCNLTEPIYGTQYSVERINQQLRDLLSNPKIDVIHDLIKPNTFLPKNMDLFTKQIDTLPQYPYLIRNEESSEVWFKQDNHFQKPKASVKVEISFNQQTRGIKNQVLFALWISLLKEEMREISYMAEMAYLRQSLNVVDSALILSVGGYNDSLPQYVKQIFTIVSNFNQTDKTKFDIQYERIMRQYQNISKMQPYQLILNYAQPLLITNGINPDELQPALQNIKFDDYLLFQKNLMQKLSFQWLVQGNMTEEIVKKFTVESENILFQAKNAAKLSPSEISDIRAVQLPKKTIFWEKNLDSHETNSAIVSLYQYKQETIKNELKMEFLANIIKTPFFEKLRTDEQLGYIVHSMANTTRAVLGFIFMIQSNVKSPQYLSQKIELFLNNFKERMNNITEAEFEQYRQSIISNLSQKPKSIFEEANDNWEEVVNNQRLFNRRKQLLEEVKNITLQDVQNLFNEIFFEEKKKLDIHFVSNNHLEENKKIKDERFKNSEIEQVESVVGFRNSSSLFPDFYSRL